MNAQIDDNINVSDDGILHCSHCQSELGPVAGTSYLEQATWRERPATEAPGSVVRADPSRFVDGAVTLRQAFCPGCLTLLLTEVVPAAEPRYRRKAIDV